MKPFGNLFIYGTLLDGQSHFGGYIKRNGRLVTKGRIKGKLYDIGNYPGLIHLPGNDGYVYGSIFELNKPAEMLKVLDEYEGCAPADPEPHEYRRELVNIETEDEAIICWVYIYNWPTRNAELIPSGDYLKYKTKNQ